MVITFWYALDVNLAFRMLGSHHHEGGSKIAPRSIPAILDDPVWGRAATEVAARAGTSKTPARMIHLDEDEGRDSRMKDGMPSSRLIYARC